MGMVEVASRTVPVRVSAVDRLRGLAVVLMLVDHVTLVFHGPEWVRMSVGRLAMPLFFLLSGHLVRRVSWRTLGIAVVGLLLPVVVPWVDTPNVLLWYAIGAVLLVVCRWAEVSPWWLVLLALVAAANGWVQAGGSYDLRALVGLMAVGALLPRDVFLAGDRLPAWLSRLGRFPLTVYVGHLLLLQLAVYSVSR